MTFQEMITSMQAPAAPAPEEKKQEPATIEEPAPATEEKSPAAPAPATAEDPAPVRSWSIPAYNYTPRAVVAGRNTLSNAANESARARIICEKWKITDHVVFKVDKTTENKIFAYYDDDAIRPGLFAIANHLKDVELAVVKVDDVSTLRRGSSKPAPAPAAPVETTAPAPEEKSAPEDTTTEEPRDDKPATEEPAPAEEKKEEPAPVPVMPEKPHKMFYMTLQAVRANVPVYLAGPAGSGKTTLAKQVAGALALSCNIMSFCAQTSKSDLLGFIDATGHYQSSSFRHTFENGGLFLFDEIDAANPNILTLLNSAIANRECTFPDRPEKPVKASENFRVIAAANTLGRGGKGDYTGRLQLDAATLDRFAVIECEYDENLEIIISGNSQWARRVQSIRAAVAVAGERLLISPRASINGARLLAAGMKQDDVEELVIWRGVNRDVRDRITARIENYVNAAD